MTAACTLPSPAPSELDLASLSANLQFCTDEINRYRASIGRPPLTRSASLENFATQAAQHDASAGVPHVFFSSNNGGGVSLAETELLRWRNYAIRDVLEKGFAEMWAAGPSGEHYDILAGPYSEVGCGFFVSGNEVSSAQDFR